MDEELTLKISKSRDDNIIPEEEVDKKVKPVTPKKKTNNTKSKSSESLSDIAPTTPPQSAEKKPAPKKADSKEKGKDESAVAQISDQKSAIEQAPNARANENRKAKTDKAAEKLREKYKDVDLGDAELDDLKMDRRKFSERLESDPAFRQKYIEEEEVKRKKKEEEEIMEDASSIIKKLKKIEKGEEEGEPLPKQEGNKGITKPSSVEDLYEELPEDDESTTAAREKCGVYIAHVEKMVINLHM